MSGQDRACFFIGCKGNKRAKNRNGKIIYFKMNAQTYSYMIQWIGVIIGIGTVFGLIYWAYLISLKDAKKGKKK